MCFVAGTKVHTPGGLKNIEDIRIGESVLAKNEVTGEVDYRKVLLTPVTKTKSIVDVITEKETISATPNHRFWVENKGWADAESLRSGDQFITSYSTKVTIKSIVLREAPQTVYNLTVDEFHTYFVGEEGVWVHNQYSPQNLPPKTVKEVLADVDKFMIENEGSTIIYPDGSQSTAHGSTNHVAQPDGVLTGRLNQVSRRKDSTYKNSLERKTALTEFFTNNQQNIDNFIKGHQNGNKLDTSTLNMNLSKPIGRGYKLDSQNNPVLVNATNKVFVRVVKSDDGIKILTDYPDI